LKLLRRHENQDTLEQHCCWSDIRYALGGDWAILIWFCRALDKKLTNVESWLGMGWIHQDAQPSRERQQLARLTLRTPAKGQPKLKVSKSQSMFCCKVILRQALWLLHSWWRISKAAQSRY